MSVEVPRKILHSKRSIGKYPKIVDSPAYDASEEDNDPLPDDGASGASIPVSIPRHAAAAASRSAHPKSSATIRAKHQLASSLLLDSDGRDSPTYDGDIESSTTAGPEPINSTSSSHYHHANSTDVSTLPTSSATIAPVAEVSNPMQTMLPVNFIRATGDSEAPFNSAVLTPEDIQAFVQKAIDGESWRKYKINPPPVGRPVRVYADGVYDLFHFGHALHLRQAKLSFPSVHLLAGVNSDELVTTLKNRSIMTHAERLEATRHCRWVDEVIADAPWVIDEAFLDKWEIDYVAHDEIPYATVDHEDAYTLVKSQGKFLPTRRMTGVSTSDFLARIISGYRQHDFDQKLKMEHGPPRSQPQQQSIF
ncbi:hypothetical protein BD779DRAFT_1443826 [Infundibulicybe gibba]|nr:hypothetical protein BD779DRAFT_1443826 [Infundibulicybe gibba]